MKKHDISLEDILSDSSAEELIELPVTKKIFFVFRLISLTIISVIFSQIINLVIFHGESNKNKAVANASSLRIVRAERGIIYDRFGKSLVGNEKVFQAFLTPKELPEEENERIETIKNIALAFEKNTKELEEQIKERKRYFDDEIVLKEALTSDDLIKISSLTLPGVKIEEGFHRIQEKPLMFSHLLGYTGLVTKEDMEKYGNLSMHDDIGKTGLEKYYNNYLNGRNGKEVYFRDSIGKVKDTKVMEQPEKGSAIETSIDKEFQEYFYARLKEELDRLGRKTGIGIAMNPENGDVLALFGVPGFDSENIKEYLNDKDKTLFNRAVGGLYNPGSTIKPLVAVAALSEGIISPQKQILSRGFLEIPNPYNPSHPSIFKDWKAHGLVNVRSALARSSNVYFYEIGGGFKDQTGLGIERLKKWWQKFNLDQKTMIDIGNEDVGFLPDPEWKKTSTKRAWLLGDTYNITIGQGDLSITPIALLNYINAIANGGLLYRPQIMKRIVSYDEKTLYENNPLVIKDIRNDIKNSLGEVREGMKDAVSKPYGTAHLLGDLPIEIAAKTGSAQVENNSKTNAFFVGYAPANNNSKPSVSIIIVVENAREGSINTIPVAKDVFKWYYENRLKDRKIES